MISSQFILALHGQLHPDSDVNVLDDMTGAQVDEITDIIKRKHAVHVKSYETPGGVHMDMSVLGNILTSAAISCHDKHEKLRQQRVTDLEDGEGNIDPDKVSEWEHNLAYYQEQLDCIEELEAFLGTLRTATHETDFYTRTTNG